MGKYAEASKYYTEAMACWKRFRANSNISNNYGTFVNMMVKIADLDMPNPFADKKDELEIAIEANVEANVEPKIEVTSIKSEEKKSEPAAEVRKTEPAKTEEKKDNYSKYSFRHK